MNDFVKVGRFKLDHCWVTLSEDERCNLLSGSGQGEPRRRNRGPILEYCEDGTMGVVRTGCIDDLWVVGLVEGRGDEIWCSCAFEVGLYGTSEGD